MSADAEVYTDAERTVLLTIWADGTHELALRDPVSRSWLPPVALLPDAYTDEASEVLFSGRSDR